MFESLGGLVHYFVVAYISVRFLKFLFILSKSFAVHVLTPKLNIDYLKDTWTVVTGGTDGIGRAYIEELAKTRGIRKFILIGRNEKKLSKTAGELKESYGAEVRTHIFDFESDDYSKLPENLGTENIGILINCAGIAPSQIGTLTELPEGLASKILRVNLMSTVAMVERVLPGMLKRDKGIIVNVSSMTGWRPLPYLSSYPASKVALSFFSDSLSDEYRGSNVKIQCLIPMLVATKVASYEADEANNIFVITTENFAKQAVRIIGRWEITTGCFQHDVQIAFGTLVSFWLFKVLFIPFVMLGVHKHRVASYQAKNQQKNQ